MRDRTSLERLLKEINRLPTLPDVLARILDTASDPQASALDLGKHIAADQSLAATLLKLVNSAHYGFYRRITNVTDAIVILGFLEIRKLVLTATTFSSFGKDSHSVHDRGQLWRHSLATGMAADRCANRLGLPINRGYFSAGLLHDIGKVILDCVLLDDFSMAVRRAQETGERMNQAEHELFGIDHAEAGGRLAEYWNLPVPVVEAIRHHHRPTGHTPDPTLTHVTTIANYVTYLAEFGDSANTQPPSFPGDSLTALSLPELQVDAIAEELRTSGEHIDSLLGSVSQDDSGETGGAAPHEDATKTQPLTDREG